MNKSGYAFGCTWTHVGIVAAAMALAYLAAHLLNSCWRIP